MLEVARAGRVPLPPRSSQGLEIVIAPAPGVTQPTSSSPEDSAFRIEEGPPHLLVTRGRPDI